jgi:hypothetical protein
MATKQFYATDTFKYQHRMLTAGDPVQMDGPTSRLYIHLGKISEKRPKRVQPDILDDPHNIPAASEKTLAKAAKPVRKRRKK